MRNFDYSKLANRTWDNEILGLVAKIHEYKGRQELFLRQKPVELKRLVEIAKNQSIESSNWIEGIATTSARFKQLMAGRTTPKNRDEGEILGYQGALRLIHENYSEIPIKSNAILQLHAELLKHTSLSYIGKYKSSPNAIMQFDSNGAATVLFDPLSPFETPEAIETICRSYELQIGNETIDPLILIPCFILDFLCIHPFTDGNGRMSRLLTLLMLYRSGYIVGQYISIEKAIADSKDSYYSALAISDKGWHDEENEPKAFIKYFLGVVLSCYRSFEERVIFVEEKGVRSNSLDIVRRYVDRRLGEFTKREVMVGCPKLGSSSVEAALKKLTAERVIRKIGVGKNTKYITIL